MSVPARTALPDLDELRVEVSPQPERRSSSGGGDVYAGWAQNLDLQPEDTERRQLLAAKKQHKQELQGVVEQSTLRMAKKLAAVEAALEWLMAHPEASQVVAGTYCASSLLTTPVLLQEPRDLPAASGGTALPPVPAKIGAIAEKQAARKAGKEDCTPSERRDEQQRQHAENSRGFQELLQVA